jgi:20S proteasome subunit beta 2
LERLNSGRDTRIATAVTRVTQKLFRYGGNIGAYLIMGGIDSKGPHVVYIHAGGNHSYLPFIAMGSGSLNCIAVLESEYRDGMNVFLHLFIILKML